MQETTQRVNRPESRDAVFACFIIGYGYAFVRLMEHTYLRMGTPIAVVLFFIIARCYIAGKGAKLPKISYVYMALALVLSVAFALFEMTGILIGLFALLILLCLYWVLCATGARQEDALGNYAARDVWNACVLFPIGGIGRSARVFTVWAGNKKGAFKVFLGVLAAIPLVLVFGNLLMRADSRFTAFISGMFSGVAITASVIRVAVAIAVGLYLFGVLYNALDNRNIKAAMRDRRRPIPEQTTIAALALLCGLYVTFLVIQAQSIVHVLGGAAHDLPEGFSYSDYAREGFFELCKVAGCNLLLFIAVTVLTEKRGVALRALLTALCACTMLIIATACVKMGLYIHQYGLTLLRVETTCFMVVLFAVFALLCVAQWKPFHVTGACLALALCASIVMAYANIGGIVARVNVNRYMDGSLAEFDMTQYDIFPYEAAPHLIALYEQTDDAALQDRITAFAKANAARENDDIWYAQSLQRTLAQGKLETFVDSLPTVPRENN